MRREPSTLELLALTLQCLLAAFWVAVSAIPLIFILWLIW